MFPSSSKDTRNKGKMLRDGEFLLGRHKCGGQ
jgi:hypothetical protein